jgi:hypothetical protein
MSTTAPDPTTEPLYAATVADSPWTPAELRPPFDLESFIGRSYERILVRNNLRHLIEKRAKRQRGRRGARKVMVRPLP